jgi:hypothetical protein
MRSGWWSLVVCLSVPVFLAGCGGGEPKRPGGDPGQAAVESGTGALPPGIDKDTARQAAEAFYKTGQVPEELRKKLEQQSKQQYGGQYPGAQKRP